MMRTWSFFDPATGEFLARRYSAPDARDLDRNTPTGCEAIEGAYDPLAQRVDIGNPAEKTVEGRIARIVVNWTNTKRIDDIAKREAVTIARAQIADLESRQLRAMREDALRPNERGPDGKSARQRLQEIDYKITELRRVLSDETDTSAR